MSYDKPNRQKYAFFFDAGNNGNETFSIYGPKGKQGRLIDYGVEGVTEAFTQDASIAIGDGSDADKYGEELALGALAVDTVKSVRTLYDPARDKTAYDALIVQPELPADGKVTMTIVDDAASGQGVFFLIVDWDD